MINLITEHLNVWTAAQAPKTSGAGRSNGSGNHSLYGIKKLRELILELAVRGKLVPQNPNDEPARVLLKKIAAEKARLVKEGKIKKEKPLPEIEEDEKPFDLPAGWEWVRMADIAQHNSGKTLDRGRNSGTLRDYITTSNLYWGLFVLNELRQMPFRDEELDKCTAKQFDLLVCEGGEAGRAAVWPYSHDICFQNHIHRVRLYGGINSYYIFRVLLKMSYTGEIEKYRKGVGISNMSGKDLATILVPLAPLAEQHRIVAKVDELMALCDQLERQQTDSSAAHQTLVETLLATLTNAADQDEFAEAWRRIAHHFDTLFTTEYSIDQLKQTILQLAVMGKLVPQDPNDEPAAVLLKKIASEKARLIKEGKIKKQVPLPEIRDDEKPFELPPGWEPARFAELSQEVSTGPFGTMIHKGDYVEGGTPLINPSHMIDGKIVEETSVTISDKKAEVLSSYKIDDGDIVMARRGEMGRCALVTKREAGWLCGTGSFRLKFHKDICRHYILLLFKTTWVRGYLGRESVGATMTNLNHGILNMLPIALPPSCEQHRIVAKVDGLMKICDALKARLNDAQTTRFQLADAMVEQAIT